MKDLVFVENNEVVTDSLVIAEMFGKDHNKVVRDIENQISKLKEAGEEKWGVANFGATQYQHLQNKQLYPKYNLTEDGFAIVAMSYTTPEAMKMKVKFIQEFKRMKEYIQQQVKQPVDNVIEFEKQLIGVKYTSEILRVDEPSKIKMLEAAHTQHGVPTNHLPVYVEEELKVSLTQLLREHDVKMSATRANARLIELGLLEIKERPSSKGGVKEFKSLTDQGQYFGSNAISPRNPKETQPLYYPSKFNELIPLLLGQVKEVS
ncbi:hypothetical protein EP18_03785 [Lysinibacillus sphaericus]|nr:Rha family transcriptional regulator [Lysinibacillus sphaericus]KEK12995.1 hypothetical protein EP18_03785 [Lysinibacillus sphaericus]